MATQDVEFDGDVWFIAERALGEGPQHHRQPAGQRVLRRPQRPWVSLSGTASVVDDPARLAELWNTFTDAWMEGGPEQPQQRPECKVDADTAEYWDSPGSKVTQLLNLVKAKTTGKRFEGDNEKVDLDG